MSRVEKILERLLAPTITKERGAYQRGYRCWQCGWTHGASSAFRGWVHFGHNYCPECGTLEIDHNVTVRPVIEVKTSVLGKVDRRVLGWELGLTAIVSYPERKQPCVSAPRR